MFASLKSDTFPSAAMPVSIAFDDKMSRRIGAEFPEDRMTNLLADMSHEIRTPIGAIIGLGHILLSTKLDEQQKQYMTILQSSAEALLVMVNRTLSLSKLGARTAALENAPFDMVLLLDQVVGIMSVKAQEKNIGLSLNYEARAARTFVGDSGHIRQIVMNLVGNAIKFTDSGEVAITFAADEKRNGISISVADTGIGIPQDKIGIIFDRFEQVDSSISRKYGGTGLGLSISKKLAESMGGTITVTSLESRGSIFVLHLRLPVDTGNDGMGHPSEDNVIYLGATQML